MDEPRPIPNAKYAGVVQCEGTPYAFGYLSIELYVPNGAQRWRIVLKHNACAVMDVQCYSLEKCIEHVRARSIEYLRFVVVPAMYDAARYSQRSRVDPGDDARGCWAFVNVFEYCLSRVLMRAEVSLPDVPLMA